MQVSRLFTKEKRKGTRNYIRSQKKFEILRTVLLFSMSLSLFVAGLIATKTTANTLTIVAALGFLPASKSAVDMILFLKYKGCPEEDAIRIAKHTIGLSELYDLTFTTYEKTYSIAHAAVRGNTIVLYSADPKIRIDTCVTHLTNSLAVDGIKHVTLKIFQSLEPYKKRLEELKSLEIDEPKETQIVNTFKSLSL